jgi:hypothetical protein
LVVSLTIFSMTVGVTLPRGTEKKSQYRHLSVQKGTWM